MTSFFKILFFAFALFLSTTLFAQSAKDNSYYGDPTKFSTEINNFLSQDKLSPPMENAVVITGSSSVRKWQHRIHQDLSGINIIARGFGGSNMNDLLFYADELIIKYKPKAVAIYEGDNDIAQGISPEKILQKYTELITKLKQSKSDIRIYFISIKPSILRWPLWGKMQKANALIKNYSMSDSSLFYIDVANALLNKDKMKKNIFIQDGLHLNDYGYDLWGKTMADALLSLEAK